MQPGTLAQARRIAAADAANQRYSNWNKYYSKVRFQATSALVGAVTTFTIPPQELRLFGYAQGQDLGPFGFGVGNQATLAETNLITASSTLSGETVKIYGVSLLPSAESEATFVKALWTHIACQFSLNGDQMAYRLGTPENIPGGGGLTGFGNSFVQQPPLQESYVSREGALSNGVAHMGNFFPFPQPVIWKPQGDTDSTLIIKLSLVRAITFTSTARAAVAGAGGISAFVAPVAAAGMPGVIGTFVTVMGHIWSKQTAPRSVNM